MNFTLIGYNSKFEKTPDSTIVFAIDDKEIMKFDGEGNIYIEGRLADTDLEVVNAFKEWLKEAVKRQKDKNEDN